MLERVLGFMSAVAECVSVLGYSQTVGDMIKYTINYLGAADDFSPCCL